MLDLQKKSLKRPTPSIDKCLRDKSSRGHSYHRGTKDRSTRSCRHILRLGSSLRMIACETMPKNTNSPRPALRIAPTRGEMVNAVGRRPQLLSLMRTGFTKPRISKWQAVLQPGCSALVLAELLYKNESMSAGMALICGLLSTHTRPRLLDRCGVLVLHELLRPKLHQVRLQTLYASSGSGMMRYFKVVDLIDISRKSRNKLGNMYFLQHVSSTASFQLP